jgi:type I restriction enzyme M protein
MNILKPGGRAAIVLPDNVLFSENASKVLQLLTTDCELDTILRLPVGTFIPYSPGVKANILFFRKGLPTKETWIYDMRTNAEKVTIRHPLTEDHFKDFISSYNAQPRKESERFQRNTISEIRERDYNLDITWLKDTSAGDSEDLAEPTELVAEALTQLETAVDSLNDLSLRLGNGKVSGNEE